MDSALTLIEKLTGEGSALKKVSLVVVVIFIYVFIDLSTGFFTNFFNGQSIDQIQKIETLLAAKETDAKTKAYLIRVKSEIISRRDYRQWSSDFFLLIQSATNSARAQVNIPSGTQISKELIKPSIRLEPWVYYHTISSGWIFVMGMFGVPFTLFKRGIKGVDVFGVIFAEIGLFLGALLFAYMFSVIPVIRTGLINIIINAILHLSLVVTFSMVFASKNEKNLSKQPSHPETEP